MRHTANPSYITSSSITIGIRPQRQPSPCQSPSDAPSALHPTTHLFLEYGTEVAPATHPPSALYSPDPVEHFYIWTDLKLELGVGDRKHRMLRLICGGGATPQWLVQRAHPSAAPPGSYTVMRGRTTRLAEGRSTAAGLLEIG